MVSRPIATFNAGPLDSFAKTLEGLGTSPLAKTLEGFGTSPLAKTLEGLDTSPLAKALEGFGTSPLAKTLERLDTSPSSKTLEGFGTSPLAKTLEGFGTSPLAKTLEGFGTSPLAKTLEGFGTSPLTRMPEPLDPSGLRGQFRTLNEVYTNHLAEQSEAQSIDFPRYSKPARAIASPTAAAPVPAVQDTGAPPSFMPTQQRDVWGPRSVAIDAGAFLRPSSTWVWRTLRARWTRVLLFAQTALAVDGVLRAAPGWVEPILRLLRGD